MKNKLPLLALLFLLILPSCQNAPKPVTESEKDSIISDVKDVFEQMNKEMNDHNVDGIMRFFDDEDFIYAAGGGLNTTLGDFRAAVNRTHTNPALLPFSLNFNKIHARVLERDLVMLNALGIISSSIGTEQEKSVQIVMTLLMKNADGKWMVISGHESIREIYY